MSIPCCPIKLEALRNFPDNQGLELMQNRLVEIEKYIASVQTDIVHEEYDDPKILISREMRANGFRQKYLDNILNGIEANSAMPDIKADRLAELTTTLNSLTLKRDEIAVLIYNLEVDPEIVVPVPNSVIPEPEPEPVAPSGSEKIMSEAEIIAAYNLLMQKNLSS